MSRFFNINELPVSSIVYKQAYRDACKTFHPDRGGDEESFKRMQEAHIRVSNNTSLFNIFSDIEREVEPTTTDGTLLSDLGLGLGEMKNGISCRACQGNGYTKTKGMSWKVCPHCDDGTGTVPKVFMCKSCGGTGRFTQKRGKVVDCRTCKGTGWFKHPRLRMLCPHCRGTRTIYGENEDEVFYHKCSNCNGTGEIEILNPVLPKGLLVSGKA